MIRDVKLVRLALSILLLAGCAGGAPRAHDTAIRIEPEPAAAAAPGDDLPPLPVSIFEDPGAAARRIQQVEIVDQDLRLVVRSLAESFGLNYQIDPAISGRVTTRLRDVTLEQALNEIVLPHGYTYTLQQDVLRVMPARLTTRIFSLDYMSLSRVGVGTTVIQRRLGATTGVGVGGVGAGVGGVGVGGVGVGGVGGVGAPGAGMTGGAGFGGGGADFIQSVSIADMWEEIRVSLEGLVFDVTAEPAVVTPAPAPVPGALPGAGVGVATRATGAYSRGDPDGRRLIINPLAGTILVSAPAETLAEVGAFLDAIEGSIHRQVLIEARIVEISLNRDFQFGVDWDVVQRIGNLDIRFDTGAGGAQMTIAPGTDPDRQVSLVLRALESQGSVNVLSSPRLNVLNNQRASLQVTTDEVFFSVTRQPVLGPAGVPISFETQIVPQQISVGIVLDVLAQIASDNTITMNVRPVITDVIAVREIRLEDGTQASAPVIDRRETDTVARVRGGETIVIGGLMRDARQTERSGVPTLSRIPVLGRLFGQFRQQTDKRELVIFITPTIVAGQPPVPR